MVLADQVLLGAVGQVVVHGEVAEIERSIVHARILPVQEPEPLTVAQDVGAQEIVVARHGWVRRDGEGAADFVDDRSHGFVHRRNGDAVAQRSVAM